MQRAFAVCLLVLLSGLFRSPSLARAFPASLDFDVSVRSAALGGASTALFWGEELNHWANPALLGEARGWRFESQRTRLVPGLPADIHFRTGAVKAGGGGVGFVSAGRPNGLGRVRLDYGVSYGATIGGEFYPFESYETVDSWGFGVSLARAFESLARVRGSEPRMLSNRADISFGMNFKRANLTYVPVSGEGSTAARDIGILVRVTPIDRLRAAFGSPVRLDLAYGGSIQNYNDDAAIQFSSTDPPIPVSRRHRHGFAARAAGDLPAIRAAAEEPGLAARLIEGMSPLISLGFTTDHVGARMEDNENYFRTTGWGIELAVARVFAFRTGRYRDREGGIDGSTHGWSVGLPIGNFAGFYYEEARFPQLPGYTRLRRKGYSFWADPIALGREMASRAP